MSNPMTPDYGSDASLQKFHDTIFSIAKEVMDVDYIKGAYYAYGSELACLRLFHKYSLSAHNPKVRAAYSENFKRWVFSLEVSV